MHPKNCWYVACTPDEIAKAPLARTICNEDIAFYRDGEGKVAAVQDFCPHRGAPLSLGYLENGELVCGYHGLRMGRDGKTTSMPKQRVGRFPCVKSYPVEERHGFIWVWTGDKELADTNAIPHLEWANNPEWAYGGGLFHINCNYQLMIDNLMDLTHETYVHASSIGQKEIDEAPVRTRLEGNQVTTSRFMDSVKAPPFWQLALKANGLDPKMDVDRWQICKFSPPSHVLIEVGVALAGQGGVDAPKNVRASSIVVDFITPETDTSMWYFWGMARNFKPQDAELTEKIRAGQHTIFSEDLEMLERQQANLLKNPNRELLKLDIDAGGVQARRLIDKLVEQEQSSSINVQDLSHVRAS
ncbi:aromatic ring-hydroxylating dioxygenase subunit alpha [uncultured Vibrio sp.]|uniref:aromatic ring-hydroxylating dioxygenase subunit alpha n=1 Tax=uncultured Vibrio sp. TaxID=114054 RepID=UPI002AAB38A9|nr:aromatic ring-hydroxylating dioxygenase subunit alpha [uncultured Vibrio sp.]